MKACLGRSNSSRLLKCPTLKFAFQGSRSLGHDYSDRRDALIYVTTTLSNAELISIVSDGVVNFADIFGGVDSDGVGGYVRLTLSLIRQIRRCLRPARSPWSDWPWLAGASLREVLCQRSQLMRQRSRRSD